MSDEVLIHHLEKLPVFQAVATLGSISRASKAVHVTQPAISRTVALLEEQLGQQLFNRSRNGVELTSSGRMLLEFSNEIQSLTRAFERRLAGSANATIGKLVVGAYPPLVQYAFPQLVTHLREVDSNIAIDIRTDVSGRALLADLLAGRLDAVFLLNPPDDRALVSHGTFSDSLALYATKKYLSKVGHSSGKPTSLTDVRTWTLITFANAIAGAANTLDQILDEILVGRLPGVNVDCFENAVVMARAGVGAAFLPMRFAALHRDLVHIPIKRFGENGIGRGKFYIVHRSGFQGEAILAQLAEDLKGMDSV